MDFNAFNDAVPTSQPAEMERTDSDTTTFSHGTSVTDDSGYWSLSTGNDNQYYKMQDVGHFGNTYQRDDPNASESSQMYRQGSQTQPHEQYWYTGTGSQYAGHYAGQPFPGAGQQQSQQQQHHTARAATGYTQTTEADHQGTWGSFKDEEDATAADFPYTIPHYDQFSQGAYSAQPSPGPSSAGGQQYLGSGAAIPTSPAPTSTTGQQDYGDSPSSIYTAIDADEAAATAATAAAAAAAAAAASSASQPGKFPCLWPECPAKAFGRAADLDRHIKMVHCRGNHKGFLCDYPRCPRNKTPFSRQDHFRDHLRDFHKEDLPRRGQAEDAVWWAERAARAVYEGWWRCNKCLGRVVVQTDGYICAGCGTHCEGDRQAVRGLPVVCDHEECGGARVFYRHDYLREHLRQYHGEDLPLPPQKDQKGQKGELGSEEWWGSRIIDFGWWRCNRCMARVEQDLSGWDCPVCRNPCEAERVTVRTEA